MLVVIPGNYIQHRNLLQPNKYNLHDVSTRKFEYSSKSDIK